MKARQGCELSAHTAAFTNTPRGPTSWGFHDKTARFLRRTKGNTKLVGTQTSMSLSDSIA